MPNETWHAVDEALADLFIRPDSALAATSQASDSAGLPAIAVSPNLGKLLSMLVTISGANRVLEIGTLGGYSTIWLARGLPEGGSVVSLELLEEHATVARANVREAGVDKSVSIRVGPAAETLAALRAEDAGPFDLVFLDADKEGYPTYLAEAVALSRPGTLIVADNVVRKGAVFDPAQSDPVLNGIRTFLADVAANPKLDAVGLQIVGSKGYDGIALIRVTG